MMNKLYASALLMALGFTAQAQSPSSNQNYVMETTVKVPGKTTVASLAGLPVGQANRTIQYFDGLGRPLQTVTWQGSSDGKKDVVQVFEYDALGREAKKYLPYAEQTSADGSYKPNGFTNQSNYYKQVPTGWDGNAVKTDYPFSITKFEPSPLNRVERQGFPGDVWQPSSVGTEHTARTSYGSNNSDINFGTTGFAVRLFRVSGGSLTSSSFYAANQLYLTVKKDENWQAADGKWGTVEEYKDKEGRLVLKRLFNEKLGNTEVLSTYYVYDDFGNLSFVLPPGANPDAGVPDATALEQFCYQYKYDGLKRNIAKHIPGRAGWEEMVYNKLDQKVLSRDPKLAQQGKWMFNKYDAMGHTVMTGMLSSSASRIDMQTTVDAESDGVAPDYPLWESRETGSDYTNQAYPRSYDHLLTVDYYDDYSFPSYSSTFNFVSFGPYANKSTMTKGLKTGSKIRNLSTGEMMLTVNYYEDNGRAIQVHSENHLGGLTATNQGIDRINTEYDFDGSVKNMERSHKAYGVTTTAATFYTYDHMGRKKTTSHSINGAGAVTLSEESYNEIGQLRQKALAGGLHTTNLDYNERGWLKNSNGTQFSMGLQYNDNASPQFNGNISGQSYINGGGNTFAYQYDKLGRLISGVATGMSELLTYDIMGNISSLNRDYAGPKAYNYTGNRLQSVTGLTGLYGYDVNGNAEVDGRNGVGLTYNHLNLPILATRLAGGGNPAVNLTYTYDATGEKLRKYNAITSETSDYIDGIHYVNTVISFIKTEEGQARYNGGSYIYEYNVEDHLGNVRLTFKNNSGVLDVLERTDYYAFGLRKFGLPNANVNRYLYNGKELQDELGMPGIAGDGQYDYGARLYDPVIARWNVVDPKAEQGRRWTPYNYAFNNPIYFVDPDGMWPWPNPLSRVQSMFNQAADKIRTSYAKVEQKVKSTYNKTANAVTKWTKENKTTLLNTAKNLQNTGDVMVVSGTVAAAVGAPVAGVGAAPGLALASGGGLVKTLGDGLEIVTNFVAGDTKSGAEGAAKQVVDAAIDKAVDVMLPGPTPKMASQFREAIKETKEITKNAVKSGAALNEKVKEE
ncbi:DUF6443 domain-containing protein [Pedobacter chitinilyticus]|uniref:RHS repeat-associated core domain-containing protein n=1 Tax=Pedobacter chitinilyticus TaxID=2233776 RepID=A0A3S3R7W8_9SPHI|nr:DUF6443 domain-containing protein [Pedobacter chitinilyticus]RWU09977.1 RHS repeat-associated core domain-containing protein [Pedobacter chitinilyticus]